MIPKKIYLTNKELQDTTTCERMVSIEEPYRDMTEEYVNLSQVWHNISEEPIYDRDIIAVDFNGYALSGTFRRVMDNEGVYYNCFCLCNWDFVAKWAYISDLLPKGGEL